MTAEPSEPREEQPIVTDKRRIDPDTGQVRESSPVGPEASDSAEPVDAEFVAELADADAEGDALEASLTDLESELAERTADLQRVHAEYANYRKRVDRDREAVRDQAVANALGELLPVIDDLARAREHGELEGAFKAVGDAVEAVVARAGIESFGAEGDPFDPNLHEALMHEHSTDVTEPTCIKVFRKGYRKGDRILRPAQVVVADPE